MELNNANSTSPNTLAVLYPTRQLSIEKVENGWIISFGTMTYVELRWNDLVERIKTCFGIIE